MLTKPAIVSFNKYKEELVHNAPTTARNAIVSIAKKVEDNVLWVMTVPVITLPSAMPKFPATNPLSTLLRTPNALIIKWVHMPTGRLKVAKPQAELTEAQTQ